MIKENKLLYGILKIITRLMARIFFKSLSYGAALYGLGTSLL